VRFDQVERVGLVVELDDDVGFAIDGVFGRIVQLLVKLGVAPRLARSTLRRLGRRNRRLFAGLRAARFDWSGRQKQHGEQRG
jgi:hypothetical protein